MDTNQLRDFIQKTTLWIPRKGGFDSMKQRDDQHPTFVSMADFNRVDPRLYPVMVDLFLKMGDLKQPTDFLSYVYVKAVLDWWENPLMFSAHGAKYCVLFPRALKATSSLQLSGNIYQCSNLDVMVDNQLVQVCYPLKFALATIPVDKMEMENRFPHWENRINNAIGLGYTQEEATMLVIHAANDKSAILPLEQPINLQELKF